MKPGLPGLLGLAALDLDDQHRLRVEGIAGMGEGLAGMDAGLVHEFERDGDDPGEIAQFDVFAEDEEGSCWEPLSVERGIAPGKSAVTVFALHVAETESHDHCEFIDEGWLERASPSCAMPIRGVAMD